MEMLLKTGFWALWSTYLLVPDFPTCYLHYHIVGVAQLVERGTHKPKVVGS